MDPTDNELSPADKQVAEIARRGFAALDRLSPTEHPERTTDCPPLLRFHDALGIGWTTADDAHRAGCRYCRNTWAMTQRVAAEPELDLDDLDEDFDDEAATTTKMSLAPDMVEYRVRTDFSMAAGASCSSQVSDVYERQLDGGFRLRLVPTPGQPELMTLAIDGRKPSATVQVLVGGQPLKLLQPLDEFGYTTVAKRDVQALLDRTAQPSLLDTPGD